MRVAHVSGRPSAERQRRLESKGLETERERGSSCLEWIVVERIRRILLPHDAVFASDGGLDEAGRHQVHVVASRAHRGDGLESEKDIHGFLVYACLREFDFSLLFLREVHDGRARELRHGRLNCGSRQTHTSIFF